jgi:GTP cyclohydrolase FolE2
MRRERGPADEASQVRVSADVELEGGLHPAPYIDTLSDTQNEASSMEVEAGVAELKVLFHDGKVAVPVRLTIQTSTGLHRGVHMSRLVHAASAHDSPDIVSWLRKICKEINRTQPGASATCAFELPYADQFIPIAIRTSQGGSVWYRFSARGMTACPCSKKMIGVGHMQRAEIEMITRARKQVDMLKLVDKLEECFSAVPKEKMKRAEEARKILEAQDHARFAEDLVRECSRRFPNSVHIRAKCFESIHAHDAIATWSKKPGWIPEF